jgi:hypothetical protein
MLLNSVYDPNKKRIRFWNMNGFEKLSEKDSEYLFNYKEDTLN